MPKYKPITRHRTEHFRINKSTTNKPVIAWRGTVVERRSMAGELSLSCTRPAADG